MADGNRSAICQYLGVTYLLMKDYQPPKGIAKMPQNDTLAVVCFLLYFIEKESGISKTKLAYQIMLLDNMLIFEGGQVHLMDWSSDMKNGCPNVEPFLIFMEEQNLIQKKSKGFELKDKNVLARFCAAFHRDLKEWLKKIQALLNGVTARKSSVLVKNWITTGQLPQIP